MPIDFDRETIEIDSKLKRAGGYLDCEMIIIHDIKKQLDNGLDDEKIFAHLKKLSPWVYEKIEANKGNADCTNYRYAAGFVDTLLKMPYWRIWMKTIDT